MTEDEVKYWPTTPHWKRRLVSSVCTSIAASSSVTPAETQRPGRRGAARRASSRSASEYDDMDWPRKNED